MESEEAVRATSGEKEGQVEKLKGDRKRESRRVT